MVGKLPKFGGGGGFNFAQARQIACRAELPTGKCPSVRFEQVPQVNIFQNRLDSADFLIQANPVMRCAVCGTWVDFQALMKENHG